MKNQRTMFRTCFSKTAGLLLVLLSLSLPCFAMKFQQPLKLGGSVFSYNMGGGHTIEGATKINASQYFNPYRKRYTGYDKGYATFDGGNLYLHYDGGNISLVRIGASDKKNTVQAPVGGIYKINTDQGITLYFLTGDNEGCAFTLVGKRPDGRFVKYVDGDSVYHIYESRGAAYWCTFDVNKDNIIVHYRGTNLNVKLQWDEAAKWFSYAKI